MYYIRCKNGSRYKVREAVSIDAAIREISHACVTGSIGSSSYKTEAIIEKPYSEWPSKCIASVIRVNSDNTEQQPYQTIY